MTFRIVVKLAIIGAELAYTNSAKLEMSIQYSQHKLKVLKFKNFSNNKTGKVIVNTMGECINEIRSFSKTKEDKEKEIKKIIKLETILSIIKGAKIKSMNISDASNMGKCLSIIAVQNYIKLDENYTLGLSEYKDVQPTYTERKAIREHVIEQLPKKYQPIVNRIQTIRKERPIIFEIHKMREEILQLERQRRELYIELAETKNKMFEVLKVCAQLKLGPYLKNSIDYLYSEYKLNHAKTTILQKCLLVEFFSRTDHAVKAIKEVMRHIDEQYEKMSTS